MTDVDVRNAPDRGRYEATPAGSEEVAGFAEYHMQGRLVVLTHTVVDPAFEGRGIGSVLVRRALDDVRAGSRQVVPLCPFVKTWIERHPDYADLVFIATPASPD